MREAEKTITLAGYYYEAEIPIDDGIYGEAVRANQTLPIRIRRFNVSQLQEFKRGFSKIMNPASQRLIYRKSDGDEVQLRDDQRTFVVPDQEIERRRLSEMTPEQLATYEKLLDDESTEMINFCQSAISAHIWLQPGVKLVVDMGGDRTIDVKTGADIFEVFAGNISMLVTLTRAIHQENTLSPEKKRLLRSLFDLQVSSNARKEPGQTPAATAIDADKGATASLDDVSAVPGPNLSISTTSPE